MAFSDNNIPQSALRGYTGAALAARMKFLSEHYSRTAKGKKQFADDANAALAPSITANAAHVDFGYTVNVPTEAKEIKLTGENQTLTNGEEPEVKNPQVGVSAPEGFEVSVNGTDWENTMALDVNNNERTLLVRFIGTESRVYKGNITFENAEVEIIKPVFVSAKKTE
ncbi:MAG: hypothetical protein KF900_14015 [Bacteroidetes bacterium]|nr:hypothetical protein [Bacteroidota bacterium]